MIKSVALSLFLMMVLPLRSQQIAQYSQWAFHQFALNPAHAGIKSCIDIHSLYRMQWVGFEGAPKSGLFTFTMPLVVKRKAMFSARHGIGVRFENDQVGQFSTNRLNIAYAGHFNFTPDSRISLGFFGGFLQTGFDPTGAITIQPDPQIAREANFIAPDAAFGAWWNGKHHYVGLILQNLVSYKWPDLGTNSFFRTHLLINGGTRIGINEHLTVLPALLIKIPPNAPWSMDLQANLNIKNTVDFGLGYRNMDAVIFMAGYKWHQKLSIMYSYDLNVSSLKKHNSNTHEISLSFNTCRSDKKSTLSCPLFE